MDVSKVLADAWAEVGKADLPTEIQEVAFREAVRLMTNDLPVHRPSSSQSASGEPGKSSSNGTQNNTPQNDNEATSSELSGPEYFKKFAHETGVDQLKLEELFYLDRGEPRINLPARKLGSNTKVRIESVALMIVVARHFGLDEEGVTTQIVRNELTRLKCLDKKNTSTYLGQVDGILLSGPKTEKVLKVRPQVIDKFTTLVDKLLSGNEQTE